MVLNHSKTESAAKSEIQKYTRKMLFGVQIFIYECVEESQYSCPEESTSLIYLFVCEIQFPLLIHIKWKYYIKFKYYLQFFYHPSLLACKIICTYRLIYVYITNKHILVYIKFYSTVTNTVFFSVYRADLYPHLVVYKYMCIVLFFCI